jgi:hypothetical protein
MERIDMLSTLSAFKEITAASSGGTLSPQRKSEQNVSPGNGAPAVSPIDQIRTVTKNTNIDAVSVKLSASRDVFSAVDDYFNLGRSGRLDAFRGLSPEDKEQFFRIVAELAKSGYVGYEELIVNKKVERHDIVSQMGNRRLQNARVYDSSKYPRH